MHDASKDKSSSYLRQLSALREPWGITPSDEAKSVQQDLACYEETEESLALLKILTQGDQDVEAGRITPMGQVVARLRADRTGRALRGRRLTGFGD